MSRKLKEHNIDTSHFLGQGHAKGKHLPRKKHSDILILRNNNRRQSARLLRRGLLESGVKYQCSVCGISSWNGKLITLDVDHINENWLDDRKENLRFLCPNCHRVNHGGVAELADASGLEPDDLNRQLRVQISSPLLNTCLDCDSKCHKNAKRCKSCAAILNNKSKSRRPPKDQLIHDLEQEGSLCAVGRKYGVSDNAVRKWVKFYKM